MREDKCAGFRWGNVKDRNHLEDMVVGRRLMLQLVFSKQGGWTWTGLLWLRLDVVKMVMKPWGPEK